MGERHVVAHPSAVLPARREVGRAARDTNPHARLPTGSVQADRSEPQPKTGDRDMNVGELKERLDDWGDHLPVGVIRDFGDPSERQWLVADVDDSMIEDEDGDRVTGVVLLVEGPGKS